MTPARSLAASVVALGFTGALSAPQAALAAPAPCERAESYAAQSGAELLRIDKLSVQVPNVRYKKSKPATESATATDAAARVLDAADGPIVDPEDSDTVSEGIGILGTAVLGALGPRPKAASQSDADADVVPPPADRPALSAKGNGGSSSTAGKGAHGSTAAGGRAATSGGSGGGGPMGAFGAAVTRSPETTGSGDESGSGDAADLEDTIGSRGSSGAVSGTAGLRATGPGSDVSDADEDGSDDGGSDDGGSEGSGSESSGAGSESSGAGSESSRADSDSSGTGSESEDGGESDAASSEGRDAAEESGKTATLSDVGVGEARTAMIAQARVSSAAYARLLDGQADGNAAVSKPVLQQAPPTNARAASRFVPGGKAGPLRFGSGKLAGHAQWEAAMACGRAVGETSRAEAQLTGLRLQEGLVRVPQTLSSVSTTALQRQGDRARTVAEATMRAGRIELVGGKVRVRVVQAPTLSTSMSAAEGGKVAYRPAVLEISGEGFATKRLDGAGDQVDITLSPDRHATESVPLSRLTDMARLGKAAPLPVPPVPGLPAIPGAAPQTESAPTAATGTRLRISLGEVRHAVKGQAIAARATAVKISMTQVSGSPDRGEPGYGGKNRTKTTLTMALGLLESAAVSPANQPAGPAAVGDVGAGDAGGAGGGLPVTGPRLDRVAMVGGGLLLAGIAAVAVSMRRRRTH
jgi:hypothetical protein